MDELGPTATAAALFDGPGEMRARCRALDWAATPLGPVDRWPPSLRTLAAAVLAHPFPHVLLWGPALVQLYNDGYRALMGAKHPAGLGQPTRRCWPEVWHLNRPIYERVWRGESVSLEDAGFPIARGEGPALGEIEDAWFTLSYSPVRDEGVAVAGVLVTVFETTGRLRAEAERQVSDARHRLIVESARDYAIVTTDPAGVIASWSPGAEATFGWTEAEAVGQPLAVTFGPADRAAGVPEAEFAGARAHGTAPDVRWHQCKDGGRVFIDGSMRALRDGAGALRGYLKVGQDITRRRALDEALRASEARFRAVADLVPDLLWESAPDGAALWYNARWHAYTGQTAVEAAGWGWLDAVHPDDRARARATYARATREGRSLVHEFVQEQRLRGADGTYHWFLVRAYPLLQDASPADTPEGADVDDHPRPTMRWLGAATDVHAQRLALEEVERQVVDRTAELAAASAALAAEVAERRQLAAARDSLRRRLASAEDAERRRLARELHDELGQELTALRLGLDDAARLASPPAAGGVLPDVALLCRLTQLGALAQRLTTSARGLALELHPPELDDLGLESALGTYAREWAARYGIAADVAVTGAAERAIPGEAASALYRIAQEALTNVAKHAGASQVSVLVDKPDGEVRLIVEDNGRGFDPEATAGRVRAERRLGLAGIRERAALAGGVVTVESGPGAGTTVYVRVPVAAHLTPARLAAEGPQP